MLVCRYLEAECTVRTSIYLQAYLSAGFVAVVSHDAAFICGCLTASLSRRRCSELTNT